jgi:hypothetical protein
MTIIYRFASNCEWSICKFIRGYCTYNGTFNNFQINTIGAKHCPQTQSRTQEGTQLKVQHKHKLLVVWSRCSIRYSVTYSTSSLFTCIVWHCLLWSFILLFMWQCHDTWCVSLMYQWFCKSCLAITNDGFLFGWPGEPIKYYCLRRTIVTRHYLRFVCMSASLVDKHNCILSCIPPTIYLAVNVYH